jgi:hypothetical protein
MATSTLTLPADPLSVVRSSFSKSRPSAMERAASPGPSARTRHPHDQEAVEMDILGSQKADSVVSTSGAPDPPVWNMTQRQEWNAIAACCMCLFLVRHILSVALRRGLMESPAPLGSCSGCGL